jgi:hypothetical protein
VTLMLTNVYVDGFNLYYGCLKGTPYKWLDLGALCQVLLPPNKIQRIRYFTPRSALKRTRISRCARAPTSERSRRSPG